MARRILPDTSIIIDGKISAMVEDGKLDGAELVVPSPVLEELQAQASRGRESGFIGLKELKKLHVLCKRRGIPLRFSGGKLSLEDIRLAEDGRVDALITETAMKEGGTLITADYVQALAAEAAGARVRYIPRPVKPPRLIFEKFFKPGTLSVHLKEGISPLGVVGTPERFRLSRIGRKPLKVGELEEIVRKVSETARIRGEAFVEVNRSGFLAVHIGNYRVTVSRPPLSDRLELSIVRRVVKLKLEDYEINPKLMDRLREGAEGLLVAGPYASGKTGFASSLADFYLTEGKVVKTLESPRELQVRPEISRCVPVEGSVEKTSELMLLARPDYAVFDELKKAEDFQVFSSMRLAGIRVVGVTHASTPVDAIRKFSCRMELGLIPQIVDTLIFIRHGRVSRAYETTLVHRVPTMLTETGLPRPVVEVRDFKDNTLEYEIYRLENENVVVPTLPATKNPEEKR